MAGPARLAATLAALVMLCLVAAGPATAAPGRGHPRPPFGSGSKDVCAAPKRGHARCLAEVATTAASPTAAPLATPAPTEGYTPADVQSAYGLTALSASEGTGQTVAVVNAFDDPTAEADLKTYRDQFGLPPCTTASRCFSKVNQSGDPDALPVTNPSWSQEASLDLQAVSAICPNCKLLLVEATDDTIANLATAADWAGRHATQVSNSYGANEGVGEDSFDPFYDHPGVSMVAASGDSGFGVSYPAASPNVTAVGGTTLTRDAATPRGWREAAWDGAGSGCSAIEPRPVWQTDPTGCGNRAVADLAAVADPNTGLAIFSPAIADPPRSVWQVFGGTSAASPIIAAYEALIGPAAAGPAFPYSKGVTWFDVLAGSTLGCGLASLCTAGPGYDGPTGLGTPAPATAPASAAAPRVTGSAQPGAALLASAGSWTSRPTAFSFAWWRCSPAACTPTRISGAAASTYALGAADVGSLVWATVDARNPIGSSGPVASNPVGPVVLPPTTHAAPPQAPAPTPTPALAITRLTIRPQIFRAARRRASVGARGARVTFAANLAAFATFKVQRMASGRRVGGRCLAPTSATRRRRACTRFVGLNGGFQFPKAGLAAPAPTRFTFSGRLRKAALRPGRYMLAAVAVGAGGQRSKTAFVAFRVVR